MVFRSGSGSGIGVGDRLRRARGGALALGAACLVLSLMLPLISTPCRAAAAAGAETASKIRIAFAGDSIVDNYWSGIERIVDGNPCLKNTVELGRFAKNGTGLTRGDRVYWPREIKRIDDVSYRGRRSHASTIAWSWKSTSPARHRTRWCGPGARISVAASAAARRYIVIA